MKNYQKITGIFLLTIFYCLSVSLNIFQTTEYSKEAQKAFYQKEIQQKYIAENQSSNYFQPISDKHIEPLLKDKINSFNPSSFCHPESYIFNKVKSYISSANILTIRTRKNDNIFPFHYFW